MPMKGLRWNRSEKDLNNRPAILDPSSPPRKSEQVLRSNDESDWSDHQSQRAASMDGRRTPLQASPQKMTNLVEDDEGPFRQSTSQDQRPRTSRLLRMKFRQHSSDTQLATRARLLARDEVPPVPAIPPTPSIIMTAPTLEVDSKPTLKRQKSKLSLFNRQQPESPAATEASQTLLAERKQKTDNRKSKFGTFRKGTDPFDDLRKFAGERMEAQSRASIDQGDGLALTAPLPRQSLSSRSDMGPATTNGDQSPSDGMLQGPQQRGRPGRAFTWFPRKPRVRASLFPLPSDRQDNHHAHTAPATVHGTPRPSTSAIVPGSPEGYHRSNSANPNLRATLSAGRDSASATALANSAATSISFAAPGALLRGGSGESARSSRSNSSPALAPPPLERARSSTINSAASERSEDAPPTPPFANGGSGRNSTSTAGRSSLSNMFSLSNRFRNSDPHSPRQGSIGTNGLSGTTAAASHSNSLNLSREVPLPDREEGETAMQYLGRVEDLAHRSQIPSILSKSGDEFRHAVLRSFMRKFAYFGDPIDMAIRKLLMEVDLPKETQQIDRVLQSFADRYHECNPGIFASADKAYFIAFSILILQTDFFNKNNKRKMTKQDYIKNSKIEGVSDDVLECFYDNIIYTPFIRVEEDTDILTMRMRKTNRKTAKAAKAARAAIRNVPTDPIKRASREPLDPYTLIFENKLETLRPPLKDAMTIEDPFSYLGTASGFDMKVLRNSKIGIIQIESKRSRPHAFMSASGIQNPEEARVGLVDLPIDKVGILWRKDLKKKTARSPWQEWGAILTGLGIYFFKNAGWVKSYTHQYEQHLKHGGSETLCLFKPPVTIFKPDYMLPTDHGVALQDNTYRRHKHSFVFFRHNGSEEVFLADNEVEMNDWLARLNSQAAFKSTGIQQRGLLGGHYDGQRHRGLRRLESSTAPANMKTVQTATGEVTIQSGKMDYRLAQQISVARRENMEQKIREAEEKLAPSIKQLEDELRDARHLLILAPIQQRTREQLVHAAGRVQAKLKWVRIELWRVKCHRDILAVDLEEERKDGERRQARIDGLSAQSAVVSAQDSSSVTGSRPKGSERLNSANSKGTVDSSMDQPANFVQNNRLSTTRDTVRYSTATTTTGEDFHTPPEQASPELTPPQTPTAQQPTPQTPLSMETSASPRLNQRTLQSNRHSIISDDSSASQLQPRAPRSSYDEAFPSPSISDYKTPTLDDDEAEARREGKGVSLNAGSDASGRPRTPVTPGTAKAIEREDPFTESPVFGINADRKVRRSLQRTLRDHSETRGHHRSRSRRSGTGSREIRESSAVIDEATALSPTNSSTQTGTSAREKVDKVSDGSPPGLKREKGSFTVHGKKASVVTFGGDWTATAGETLQRIKAATSPSQHQDNDDASTINGNLSLTRLTSNVIDDTPDDSPQKDLGTDTSTTPTPGSPALHQGFKAPAPKSSLSLRERRGIRKGSSTSFGSRSTDVVNIDEERIGKARQASVEA